MKDYLQNDGTSWTNTPWGQSNPWSQMNYWDKSGNPWNAMAWDKSTNPWNMAASWDKGGDLWKAMSWDKSTNPWSMAASWDKGGDPWRMMAWDKSTNPWNMAASWDKGGDPWRMMAWDKTSAPWKQYDLHSWSKEVDATMDFQPVWNWEIETEIPLKDWPADEDAKRLAWAKLWAKMGATHHYISPEKMLGQSDDLKSQQLSGSYQWYSSYSPVAHEKVPAESWKWTVGIQTADDKNQGTEPWHILWKKMTSSHRYLSTPVFREEAIDEDRIKLIVTWQSSMTKKNESDLYQSAKCYIAWDKNVGNW